MINKRRKIKRLLVAFSSLFIVSAFVGCKTETIKNIFVAPPQINEGGEATNISYALDDSGLFASVNGVQEIALEQKIPQTFIDYDLKCKQEGVFISGTDSASLYYTQVVDLNKVQGDLISFDAFYSNGYSMKEVTVDVIDIYDAENKFSVKWCTASGTHVSNLLVNCNGVELGCNNGGVGVPNGVAWRQYGTICYGTNFRELTDYGHVPFHFGFDVETQSIGVRARSTETTYTTALDLDNPIHIGEENLFKGFTTGEVYLKVTFGGINVGELGAITITEIGGRVMSGDTAKTTPSSILKFDRFTNRLKNLPLAQVGKAYPVPQAIKNDLLVGELEVGATVTSPSGVTNALDTSFVPTETGVYELLYTTKDVNGYNISKKLYVEALAELTNVTIESSCADDEAFFAGEKAVLPNAIAFGGSGVNNLKTTYTFNGEKIQSDVDGRYLFTDKGTLKMQTVAIDYLGEEVYEEFTYAVVATAKLILNSPLPTVIQSGVNYTLPDFSAVVVGETDLNLEKQILVDGVILPANRNLCVSDKESVTIQYIAGTGTEYEVSKEFKLKVIDALGDENIDVMGLFTTKGTASVEPSSSGILLKANKTGDSIAFANPISATYSELYFYLTDDLNYEYVEIKLTDALDATEAIKFRLYKDNEIGDNFKVQDANGQFSLAYPFALEKKMVVTERYHFFYDNTNRKIDNVNSVELAKIVYNTQGYRFSGFSSGAMRIEWAFFGVTGNASFCVATLGNQRFGNEVLVNGDIIPPEIAGKGQIPQGNYAVGSTVIIPATNALDVLQNQASAYLTVIAPNGEKLLNNATTEKDYELSLNLVGNYKLSYYITDLQDNSRYVEYTISSMDLELPVVSLDGGYKELYKVGDSIKIVPVVATDDITASQDLKVTVVLYDFDYKKIYLTLGEEFRFEHEGMYKIVYLVEDQAGNVALYTCETWVM